MASPPVRIEPGPPPRHGTELLQLQVPSRLEDLPAIIATVAAPLESAGIVGQGHEWPRLCLDEALTTSMLHGNEGDPLLWLTISIRLTTAMFWIAIEDCGCGSEASALAPADAAETWEFGRGIRLLQSWLPELCITGTVRWC